jgi:membrane associated rhomboid family serine protease
MLFAEKSSQERPTPMTFLRNGPEAQGSSPSLQGAALSVALFVLGLWVLWALQAALGLSLYRFGVYPREISGLIGVVTAPFIHGSWQHLFANTLPLLVLGTALLYGYPRSAGIVIAAVWLVSGLAVWLFGRASFHIGASGLAHGLMFFLFTIGILRRDRRSAALALMVFFLYGGMVATILPRDPAVSFESHLFGALTGLVLAFLLRWHDPLPPSPRYSWEDEEADEKEADP